MKHIQLGTLINAFLFLVLSFAPFPVSTRLSLVNTTNTSGSAINTVSAADDITPVPIPKNTNGSPITKVDNIIDIFKTALKYTAIIFWIASTALVFYSAYLFAASGGEPKAVSQARGYLLYAAIGMAVGIIAYGMPVLVQDILKTGTGNSGTSSGTSGGTTTGGTTGTGGDTGTGGGHYEGGF